MPQWLKELQCRVTRIEYDFDRFIGRLHMVEDNCCDMDGCIKMFERIDPAICKIETFAGGKPDTIYMCKFSRWQAYRKNKVPQ